MIADWVDDSEHLSRVAFSVRAGARGALQINADSEIAMRTKFGQTVIFIDIFRST